jgi:zinc transport system substrate-binding protein
MNLKLPGKSDLFRVAAAVLLLTATARAAEPLEVIAGVPPVAYLVERIGGEHVAVDVLLQPGQDPHTYEPTPKQVRSLARAKLFFRVGMPFEDRLIEKIQSAHENIAIVDTTSGITKRLAAPDEGHDHGGRGDEHHAEADYDPHVWLSPPNLRVQAENIAAALAKADAQHAADYRANQERLDADLAALDARIAARIKPFAGRIMFVFHPAFGYFADRYGLKQKAIQAGGKQPSLMQLQKLIHEAKAAKAKTVFVQPQFDPRSAAAVADAIGGKAVPLNDMSKDVFANLEEIAGKVEQGLRQ